MFAHWQTNLPWMPLQPEPQIPDLSHSVLSPMSFRLDYRRPGGTTSMFQRNIRLQVDITCATPPSNESSTPSPNFDSTPLDRPTIYCITFTLLNGKLTHTHCLPCSLLLPPSFSIEHYRPCPSISANLRAHIGSHFGPSDAGCAALASHESPADARALWHQLLWLLRLWQPLADADALAHLGGHDQPGCGRR
mgnify:CR=1 FL=1